MKKKIIYTFQILINVSLVFLLTVVVERIHAAGPVFIDTNVNGTLDVGELSFVTIGETITAATAGNTIVVPAGTYTESVNDTKGITLQASGAAMIVGQVTLNALGSKIYGFDITNPNGNFGVLINGFGNTEASNNTIHHIGTGAIAGANYGIYFQDKNLIDADDVKIENNTISNIGTALNGSNGGIGIGDSTGNSNITGVVIEGNTISNITAHTAPVSPGKGAYGIILNHAIGTSSSNMGSISGAEISENTISNLSGRWAHGIGLEGNTPSAVVTDNIVEQLTSSSIPSNAVAVMFEQNAGAESVTLQNNHLDTTTISFGVVNVVPGVTVDVTQNYWGVTSIDVAKFFGAIDFDPWYTDSSQNILSNMTILHVITVVVNDNSGTKVISDFSIFLDGGSVVSGVTNVTTVGLHTISETPDSGYTTIIGGDCAADGTITLLSGDIKTCTITNADIPVSSGSGSRGIAVPPLIEVVKIPNPLVLPGGPGLVTYTYTLRNIGTTAVSDVTMVGDSCVPINFVSGDTNADTKLDMNETWIYSCETNLSKTHTNLVTATGWANGISASDIASATVVVGIPRLPDTGVVPPLIHITKVPSTFILPFGGGMVTYTQKVTNPGIIPISNVQVKDEKCGPMNYISGDTNSDSILDTTETWVYTCKAFLTQTTTNTVTVEGVENGTRVRDFAIVTVVVGAPMLGFPNTGPIEQLPTNLDNNTMSRSNAVIVFQRSLKRGTRGTDVAVLQNTLKQIGISPGAVDGLFGPITRAAVVQYQASTGLSADGIFGPLTRAMLISDLEE